SEIFQGLINMNRRSNETFDQETINTILAQNPNSPGIVKLVKVIDPDKDGQYHNVNDVLNYAIKIWRNEIPRNNLDFDFNGDGVVSSIDASTLFNLHMNNNNLKKFTVAR
ncbi:hypothetical protein E3A20_28160, partial [Planctomyces bekefii]